MMSSCSISGVPRKTHTTVRTTRLTGRNVRSHAGIFAFTRAKGAHLLIDPKDTTSPSGKAKISVRKKSSAAAAVPSSRDSVTVQNIVHPPHVRICPPGQTRRQRARRPLPFFGFSGNYRSASAICTPYVVAISSIVPSAYSSSSTPSMYAARSEPLRQPMPYSSSLSDTVFVSSG